MEPAEHEADHSEADPGFGALRIGLIVPGQLAMPHEPGEGSLHNPSPGQHDKTLLVFLLGHDLDRPAGDQFRPENQIPA